MYVRVCVGKSKIKSEQKYIIVSCNVIATILFRETFFFVFLKLKLKFLECIIIVNTIMGDKNVTTECLL